MRRVGTKQILLCVVAVMAPLSGCGVGNPAYNGDIRFSGDIGVANGGFVMDGEILNGGMESFDNVEIQLYYENKTEIDAISLGQFNGGTSVSIQSPKVPEYVIIHSPGFWTTSKVTVDYFSRSESGNYTVHTISERSELPVEPDRTVNSRESASAGLFEDEQSV